MPESRSMILGILIPESNSTRPRPCETRVEDSERMIRMTFSCTSEGALARTRSTS